MPWTGGGRGPEVSASAAQPASVLVRRPAEKRLGRGAAPRSQPTPPTPSDAGAEPGSEVPTAAPPAGVGCVRSAPAGPAAARAGAREARTMSGGEVVCSGWLRKSPPEKKLKRYVSKSFRGSRGSASRCAGTSPRPARPPLAAAGRARLVPIISSPAAPLAPIWTLTPQTSTLLGNFLGPDSRRLLRGPQRPRRGPGLSS